ncbi:MAG: carboxylate-amine ligase [Gammaproteobacteria bacterium]|nr:carboxylate-amine ligase [Gammaproteobacteria bacterium]NNF49769.1 carboxylate-amine ligase [Woeseiaceae bacterium]MBT8094131.1 carboxylate-amine ligase [Gammaproteobacteria bacterium]MBT8105864.1 carboxylate-amine ligase [Gammaproteobacteria bacterium]NNK25878.1 carboxylate-amine ligase [Woeseiaceae bacterium]
MKEPSFTLGIEEEYLLVDKETRGLVIDPPETLMAEAKVKCGEQVTAELLRSQIEVGTKVSANIQEAHEDLVRLRSGVIEVAANHGLAPIAASTHPFSAWMSQKHTEKDRYDQLTSEMQGAARRLVICGMHVHVGIDDDELRIDLMNQMSYFLPHLLALSCSSPFWLGRDTGLKSYRLTIFDALPRTGIPERFASWAEYQRHIGILQEAGLIEDATRIWWDLRPSGRYPTLETRVMDVCTRLDDTVALASLLACVLRMLWRLRMRNQRWRLYTPMLIRENRWRAMRYSFDEGLIDLAKGMVVPFDILLEELLSLIAEDARALGCEKEVKGVHDILTRGTSAHRQLRDYELERASGANDEEALRAVVDTLITDTAEGV